MKESHLFFVDSYGRSQRFPRRALRSVLKKRLVRNVKPEVAETLERYRSRMRHEIRVKDLACELGVKFTVIRAALEQMEEAGVVKRHHDSASSVANEKYKIVE